MRAVRSGEPLTPKLERSTTMKATNNIAIDNFDYIEDWDEWEVEQDFFDIEDIEDWDELEAIFGEEFVDELFAEMEADWRATWTDDRLGMVS